jgi:hypothetical protein
MLRVTRIKSQGRRPPMGGIRISERDVWEYVSVDHSACTSVCLVIVGNAGVGFEFPGGKTLFVSSFDEVVGVV